MNTRTEAQEAKDYLIRSLDQTLWNKTLEAQKTFGLVPLYPKNMKELRDFVEKGWIEVTHKDRDDDADFDWDSPMHYLRFQNPDVKEDQEGYEAAEKQMRKDASDVKDQIIVLGAEKGLEALNAFKAKEYK